MSTSQIILLLLIAAVNIEITQAHAHEFKRSGPSHFMHQKIKDFRRSMMILEKKEGERVEKDRSVLRRAANV